MGKKLMRAKYYACFILGHDGYEEEVSQLDEDTLNEWARLGEKCYSALANKLAVVRLTIFTRLSNPLCPCCHQPM